MCTDSLEAVRQRGPLAGIDMLTRNAQRVFFFLNNTKSAWLPVLSQHVLLSWLVLSSLLLCLQYGSGAGRTDVDSLIRPNQGQSAHSEQRTQGEPSPESSSLKG